MIDNAANGVIRKTGDTYAIVFVRHLAKPIEKVWAALTVPERIADWFAEMRFIPDVRLGARVEVFFPDDEPPYQMTNGEVVAFEPPRLFDMGGSPWRQQRYREADRHAASRAGTLTVRLRDLTYSRMTRIRGLAFAAAVVFAAGQVSAKPIHRSEAAQAPHVIPAVGDLGREDLLQVVANRVQFHKADAFAPEYDETPLIGRTFRVVRKFEEGGNPGWRYLAPHLSLDFTPAEIQTSLGGSFFGLVLSTSEVSLGSEVRQNAFGAKAVVTTLKTSKVIVGSTKAFGMPWLTLPFTVTPDEGRSLSAGSYAVLSGTLVPIGGAVTKCGANFIDATIDHPAEVEEDDCLVSATFTSVQFFDHTGRLLGSWTPSAAAAAPAKQIAWLRQPEAQDLASVYPDRASRMNVSGQVSLRCLVTSGGTLDNCSVTEETPADQEFGSAALKAAKFYQADPGVAAAGTPVEITIPFTPPTD